MHSSRMRIARLLPVSPSMHCSWWGSASGLGGGVCLWSGGGCLPLVQVSSYIMHTLPSRHSECPSLQAVACNVSLCHHCSATKPIDWDTAGQRNVARTLDPRHTQNQCIKVNCIEPWLIYREIYVNSSQRF